MHDLGIASMRWTLQLGAVEQQLEYAVARLDQVDPINKVPALPGAALAPFAKKVGDAFQRAVARIRGFLRGVSAYLARLLVNHNAVKEWSLKGSVTTPQITKLFGITGTAELTVTFEKNSAAIAGGTSGSGNP